MMLLDPVIPIAWIACIAVVVLGSACWFHWQSGRHLGAGRNGVLLFFRVTALAGILILLLQPSREEKVVLPVREKSLLLAVDVSASMREPHSTGASRIDAVRADLEEAGLLHDDDERIRFFTFDESAEPITADALRTAAADGQTTRIDRSVGAMLRLATNPPPAALVLLSDGHDFDLVPPGETARRAVARDLPIYTVAYGTLDTARDVAVRIANYHPHTFVRQSTRLEAFIRTVGCAHETLTIDLLLDGAVVATKSVETGLAPFQTVHFDVTHEEPGQFEYSFRSAPITNERELSNNIATTYLNVVSERLRILEIEGAPFWDTTFLRRSFGRNDKFDIDSLVAFTGERVRPIRSNPERLAEDLRVPESAEDLKAYDLVIFGRDVQRVIGLDGIRAVEEWVKSSGGVLVFARGQAWPREAGLAEELEPISWDTSSARGVRLEVTPEAGNVPAFRLLREVAAENEFPEVIAFPSSGGVKTLASTFSVAEDQSPAVVYRRYGNGQTLSLGVGNLWRWVFNPKADYDNNAYDRFWDQLILWLLANHGVTPLEGFSLRPDAVNLPLGETVRLRFGVHGREPSGPAPQVSLFMEDAPVTSLVMTEGEDPSVHHAEFTPRETGSYRAEVKTADGEIVSTRFIVFREEMETTETAMDRTYLEQLAKASSGRLFDPSELKDLVAGLLRDTSEQPPLTRKIPLWDSPWIYFLLCLILAADWYARRRWGLI